MEGKFNGVSKVREGGKVKYQIVIDVDASTADREQLEKSVTRKMLESPFILELIDIMVEKES